MTSNRRQAGENVIAAIGAKIDAQGARIEAQITEIKAETSPDRRSSAGDLARDLAAPIFGLLYKALTS